MNWKREITSFIFRLEDILSGSVLQQFQLSSYSQQPDWTGTRYVMGYLLLLTSCFVVSFLSSLTFVPISCLFIRLILTILYFFLPLDIHVMSFERVILSACFNYERESVQELKQLHSIFHFSFSFSFSLTFN